VTRVNSPPRMVEDPGEHASTRIAAVMLEAGADHPEIDDNARLIVIVNNGAGDASGAVCGMGFPGDDGDREMMRVAMYGLSSLFKAHGINVTFASPGCPGLN